MPFNPESPLEKTDGESAKANAALRDYFAMGAGRSLRGLLEEYVRLKSDNSKTERPPTDRWVTLSAWSHRNDWVERVKAQVAIVHKQNEQFWVERSEEVRLADDRDAQALRDLAQSILAESPSFIRQKTRIIRGRDGEPDTKVVTMALKIPEATRAVELASKLQRLSAEMADPAKRVEIEVKKEVDGILQTLEENLPDDIYNQVLSAIAGAEEAGEEETK